MLRPYVYHVNHVNLVHVDLVNRFSRRHRKLQARVFVLACDNYVNLVPFVEETDLFFLKIVIPSRKATRDYLKQGEADADD